MEAKFYAAAASAGLVLEPQRRIGQYVMDFAVRGREVGIEIDGHDSHKTKEQRTHDAQRQRYLEKLGWKVVRFTGTEVFSDAAKCVQELLELLDAWA
jgi:very-short-patch-repair endonuclease